MLKTFFKWLGSPTTCDGNCMQLTGVACPTSCKNFGKRLDGCHVCDCVKGGKRNAKSTING